jgi:hypothetical protein
LVATAMSERRSVGYKVGYVSHQNGKTLGANSKSTTPLVERCVIGWFTTAGFPKTHKKQHPQDRDPRTPEHYLREINH